MKIKIEFYRDEDMTESLGMDIADDVLDAEGKLAILARNVQRKLEQEENFIPENDE